MSAQTSSIDALIAEYQGLLSEQSVSSATRTDGINWDELADLLESEGEWTSDGANALISLVHYYGGFMLRNALALAVILGVEDGASGL